jgi:hydrogenase maturation protease
MATTVIIGLGNPILTDDSVGVQAARQLKEIFKGRNGVEVIELYAGGLRLIDALSGHTKAVIIDAMQTGAAPGTVKRFAVTDLPKTRNTVSTHDVDLPTALGLARSAGLQMPDDIVIYGIEAVDVANFSEVLTPAVATALRDVVEDVAADIRVSRG